MKKNVGTLDAIFRITIGLAGLAWSTGRFSRRTTGFMPLVVAFFSAMKVAEGVTRFCPLLGLFKVSTVNGFFNSEKEVKSPYRINNYARRNPETASKATSQSRPPVDYEKEDLNMEDLLM